MTSAASRVARTVRADIQAQTAYPVAPSAADVIKLDAMECPYPLPQRCARPLPKRRSPPP